MNKDLLLQEEELKPGKWKAVYKATGILTIIMLIIIPLQILIFTLWPHPQTTIGWLELLKDNWILGVIHLDVLLLINNIILSMIYFSFLLSMYKRTDGTIIVAFLAGIMGIISYFASNKSIEMFFISKDFFSTPNELTRSMLLSSAKNMLLEWNGTAYVIYYFLNAIALLLISIAMFQSKVYNRTIAIFGLVSAFFMFIPANFGLIGMIFALLSLIPWYIFSILITRVFFKLGSKTPPSKSLL